MWEAHILQARVRGYAPEALDRLCSSGRLTWFRPVAMRPASKEILRGRPAAGGTMLRTTPIALARRPSLAQWRPMPPPATATELELSSSARALAAVFERLPAAFFEELLEHSALLRTQIEAALGELTAAGLVTADSFAGLRTLLAPPTPAPGL